MEFKGGLLKPFEVCEFADKCKDECHGRDQNRENKLSCGLRRGVLMANGFKVVYGKTIDEINT